MPKKIAAVGVVIPGGAISQIPLRAKRSLLDYDIAVFDPDISDYCTYSEDYRGKPSLDDSHSFQLKEALEHWKQEILEALKAGKTIFVLLNSLQEVYVETGEKQYSGTGRNQRVTRIVELLSNYRLVPGGVKLRASKGNSMRLAEKDNVLATYWADMCKESEFRVTIDGKVTHPLVFTRTGQITVGARLRYESLPGSLFLLPYVDFDQEEFIFEKDDKNYWTDEATQFGARFVAGIVGVDRATRESGRPSPPPTWLTDDQTFALPAEKKLRGELLQIEIKIESLSNKKAEIQSKMADEAILKGLVFENGTPLETAVLEALRLLGFEAHPFKDSDSEFDVVFESPEGRLLGEVEGKDNRAINIDKLRQLEMNLHEDLARDEINTPAKGVLIGNAHRLTPPTDRGEFFTAKCVSAAKRTQTALVRSIDLFSVAKYLSGKKDARFARKCRHVLLTTVGVVSFPQIPESKVTCSEGVAVKPDTRNHN